MAENNDNLPPGSLKVTCGLTACTPGSAPGPKLGNEYWRIVPLPLHVYMITAVSACDSVSQCTQTMPVTRWIEDYALCRDSYASPAN